MQPRRASAYLTLASASASPPGDRRQYSLIVFSQNAAVGESYFDPRADHLYWASPGRGANARKQPSILKSPCLSRLFGTVPSSAPPAATSSVNQSGTSPLRPERIRRMRSLLPARSSGSS